MAGGEEVEVKVLGDWSSPFVMRAKIALNLKGVKYENLEETLSNKSQLLLNSNPVYKKVPVLIHNGKPICESLLILQYIDEAWVDSGPSILPSDPYAAAMARFWAFYIDDKWLPAFMGIPRGKTEEAKVEAAREAIAGLQILEEVYEKLSKGKDFFGGNTIGYLDIALGSHLGWIKAAEKIIGLEFLEEKKMPNLTRWANCFCSDDAVKGVMPKVDELVEFAKKLQSRN
ncbi:hypothetical protein J5N97_021665 [Dioscorea zingiberensis]|uniref:glutathione transferase n=1 Tax=Dioscorea zingiberensis TaxID=325984 RepID=A0A9D5C9A3_9LILI|nr:hypothetical protein J5N97_021665 [Dioscorea zingiberensis]